MLTDDISKLRLLAVMQLLNHVSSKEHPLGMHEIITRLKKQGITAERKTISRDLTALRTVGYQISFTRTPQPGYYLTHHLLEAAEVHLLLDAIGAAPFLTEAATRSLTVKLQELVDCGEQRVLQEQVYFDTQKKLTNDEVVDTISVLQQAIAQKQKVTFTYHHRVLCDGQIQMDSGKQFYLSPYALFWRDDHYYLAGNYEKYDTVGNYRLDRMYSVVMLPEPVRPYSEITPYTEYFDTPDYLRHEFYMFGGREEQLLLRCDNGLLDMLTDRFGTELEVLEWDASETFTAHVSVRLSEGLYDWLLQCGARLVVLSPTYVRDEMRGRLCELYQVYRIPTEEEKPPKEGGCEKAKFEL